MGLLYDRIRGTCAGVGSDTSCKISVEAFNMALIGWADGIWTKQNLVDAFALTPVEVGPGDGTYITLEDMKDWYLASTNKVLFLWVVGQIFRHLETVNAIEMTQLEATDAQVAAYMQTL